MPVKVSIVVGVDDPGSHTHDCVQSLLRQTMPTTDFEILLVCHTATDTPTATWVEALSRSHQHVHALRPEESDENSDGTDLHARGLAAATGEYVQVVEAHERLAPSAIRRLYGLAHRNQADLVLGKVASPRRQTLPASLRRARGSVAGNEPLLWESLRPFALFRRAFLEHHQIALSHADRELTLEASTMRALLFARVVSVLGDAVSSYEVPHEGPPGPVAGMHSEVPSARWAPARYYEQLRELVDFVQRHTEPGELRDTVLHRLYTHETLNDLRGNRLLRLPQPVREEVFGAASKVAGEQLFDPVHESLPLVQRLESMFVRDGRLNDLTELASRCDRVRATAQFRHAEWRKGQLQISLEAELVRTGTMPGTASVPINLVRHLGYDVVDDELLHGLVDEHDVEITPELRRYRAFVVLVHRSTGAQWATAATLDLVLDHEEPSENGTRCRMSFRGTATLDPERAGGRYPLDPGLWDLRVVVEALGLSREAPLTAAADIDATATVPPAVVGKPARVVIGYLCEDRSLVIDVDRHATTLGSALTGHPVVPQPSNGRRLELTLGAVSRPGTSGLDATMSLRGENEHSSSLALPARLVPYGSRLRLIADVEGNAPGPVRSIRPGTWHLWAGFDGEHAPQVPVGAVQVDQRSRMYLVGADRIGPLADRSRRLVAAAVSRPGLRRLGVHVVDWLPERWQRRIRLAVRRAQR